MYFRDKILEISIVVSCLVHAAVFLPFGRAVKVDSFIADEGNREMITVFLQTASDKQNSQNKQDISEDSALDNQITTADSLLTEQRNNSYHVELGGGEDANPYYALLRKKIIQAKQYPQRAHWLKICGSNRVMFSINADGSIDKVRIIDGSGYIVLDKETCDAVRRASPFPPIPSEIPSNRLDLALTLKYEL